MTSGGAGARSTAQVRPVHVKYSWNREINLTFHKKNPVKRFDRQGPCPILKNDWIIAEIQSFFRLMRKTG